MLLAVILTRLQVQAIRERIGGRISAKAAYTGVIVDASHGLQVFYADQGKPDEAEKMHKRALVGH